MPQGWWSPILALATLIIGFWIARKVTGWTGRFAIVLLAFVLALIVGGLLSFELRVVEEQF
jgi:uncharacterized protein YneF (UPF0154 family)